MKNYNKITIRFLEKRLERNLKTKTEKMERKLQDWKKENCDDEKDGKMI